MAAVFASAGAMAEARTSDLPGTTSLYDRIKDIQTAANTAIARGNVACRFGNPEFRPGLSGRASLRNSGQTGNNASQDFSAGARLRYAAGPLIPTVGFAADFSESNHVRTKRDIFVVYDANHYIKTSSTPLSSGLRNPTPSPIPPMRRRPTPSSASVPATVSSPPNRSPGAFRPASGKAV